MGQVLVGRGGGGAIGSGGVEAVFLRAGRLLALMAAPTFAAMALLTAMAGAGSPQILCLAGAKAPLTFGMAPMYALMSVFHMTPWLTLVSRRRGERQA